LSVSPSSPEFVEVEPNLIWRALSSCILSCTLSSSPDHRHHRADLATGKTEVLAGGRDFYAAPRLSPDGSRLAWVTWDHPNMPWDDTEVWVADVGADGKLSGERKVRPTPALSSRRPENAMMLSCEVRALRAGQKSGIRARVKLWLGPFRVEFLIGLGTFYQLIIQSLNHFHWYTLYLALLYDSNCMTRITKSMSAWLLAGPQQAYDMPHGRQLDFYPETNNNAFCLLFRRDSHTSDFPSDLLLSKHRHAGRRRGRRVGGAAAVGRQPALLRQRPHRLLEHLHRDGRREGVPFSLKAGNKINEVEHPHSGHHIDIS